MDKSQRLMLLDWMRKVHQLEYAHRFESIDWRKRNRRLNISMFVISGGIATSFQLPFDDWKIPLFWFTNSSFWIGLGSFLLTLGSGFLLFFKPNEKSELHKNTGATYEHIRHKLEELLTGSYSEKHVKRRISQIREEWESVDAINTSQRNFLKGKAKVKSFGLYPKELEFVGHLPLSTPIEKRSLLTSLRSLWKTRY